MAHQCDFRFAVCGLWILLLLVSVTISAVYKSPKQSRIHPGHRFQDCGGIFNESRGHFKTPNFPGAFPVPVSCRWVIEAPHGQMIMLYFTQFYLREGVRAKDYTDYDKFWGRTDVGERDLGVISADNKTIGLSTCSPFLVIDLEVDDLTNINLRVLDALMDVYGFNITYEMVPVRDHCSTDLFRVACSTALCNFNGDCLGSANLDRYWCQCYENFFGDQCQYGPDCDPDRGKNGCLNGGNCSYAVGSRVYYCDCPEGFGGLKCEHRQDTINGNACQNLKCAHLCKRNKTGSFHCECNHGFRLAVDNHTCISSGLTRYVGSVKLRNASYVPTISSNKSSSDYIRLKSNIESKLSNVLGTKVRHLKNVTILEFRPGAVVDFHFFGGENESDVAQEALNTARHLGRLGNIFVDTSYMSFSKEPAVDIRTLRVEPRDHLVVGQELRLACVTLGSSALKFHWLKDGAQVNVDSKGSIWQKLLPKNAKDEYTAILGIDRVEEAHTGSYTCKVTDWGQTQTRTAIVAVLSPPQVIVIPMSTTVKQGDEVSILCLSHVIRDNKFGYNWAKNGIIMGTHDDAEILEDIYPTGSRVKIRNAKYPATYSCIVSGMTGETTVDSRVTVIDPNVIKVCPSEDYLGIRWNSSAVNSLDINLCPVGFDGDVQRRCTYFNRQSPVWEEPDFSGCRSFVLLELHRQFDNLRVGFLVTTSGEILEKISAYLMTRDTKLFPGEGGYILEFIDEVHQFQERNSIKQSRLANGTDVYFEIMSQLLRSAKAINSEMMIIRLIQAAQRRALFLSTYLLIGQEVRIDNDALAVDIFRHPSLKRHQVIVPSRQIKRGSTLDAWTTDSIIAKINFPNLEIQNENSIDFAVIVYKNLSRLLPKRSSKKGDSRNQFVDVEYEMNSRLVTVAYNAYKLGPSVDTVQHVNVLFNRTLWEVERKGWNITCGIANLTSGKLEWFLDACSLVTIENVTSCLCSQFGTYVVLLTTLRTSGREEFTGHLDYVVAAGCFIGLLWILLTLICLIVCWRNVFQSFIVLKIHICLGFMGVFVTLFIASNVSLPETVYPYIVTSLEFFMLEPLSMHVCLELFLYLELANVKHIQYAITKIASLGWGIPTIVTGATLIFQTQYGFEIQRWWMQFGDTYFYGLTISSVILLALYILLYLVVNLELHYKVKSESPQRASARRRIGLLRRSLILQLSKTTLTIMFFMYSNSPCPLHQYLFSISCGFTGFLVFYLYTINSETPGCFCSKRKHLDSKSSGTSSSSRSNTGSSFFKLEVKTDHLTMIECPVNDNKTHINNRHRRCHHHHCTLIGESKSREMEDLLHDGGPTMTSEDTTTDNTRESFLVESPPIMDDLCKPILVDDLIRVNNETTNKMCLPGIRKRRVVDISIVNYDGSPKKYPSFKDGYIEEEEIDQDQECNWPPPPPLLPSLRPEPVRCYIRCSPEVSSLPRESPTSSATSADVSSSSSGLKHAQLCHNAYQQHHQVPFCYHWPAFEPPPPPITTSSSIIVDPDVTPNSRDFQDPVKTNHLFKVTNNLPDINYVNLAANEHKDTVV